MSRKKQDLADMFPPITKEYLREQIKQIKKSNLSHDEQIRQLELLKVDVMIASAPVKFFRGFKNFAKSIS